MITPHDAQAAVKNMKMRTGREYFCDLLGVTGLEKISSTGLFLSRSADCLSNLSTSMSSNANLSA